MSWPALVQMVKGNYRGTYPVGSEVTRKQGRKGERERQMTDIKIESAKNLLANGVAPKDVAKPSVYSFPRPTAGFPHPAHL